MRTLAEYIEAFNQYSPAILFASFDVAIKVTVVLALAWVVTYAMRRASASARHWIWMTAGVSLAIIPIVAMSLPAWRVLPSWTKIEAPAERQPSIPTAPAIYEAVPVRSAPDFRIDAKGVVATAEYEKRLPELSLAAWAIIAWAIGFAIALLPLPVGALALRRLRRNSKPLRGAAWEHARNQAARALSIRRRVELLVTARRAMPMTWGIFRPMVLLPRESDDWSAQRRSAVLLHELAHVRRMDCLWQPVFHFICAAYWFHPLSWVARAKAQDERERSCDDLVLTCGTKQTDYAEELLHVASTLRITRLTGAAAIAMARPSQLEDRLLAILDAKRNRKALTWIGAALVVLVLSAVDVPIALLRAQTSSVSAQSPSQGDDGLIERLPGDGPDEVADLSGQKLRPADVNALAAKSKLKRLELGFSSVSDSDLAAIAGLPAVEWLDVSKTFAERHQKPSVTDNGIKSLSTWKSLRTLKLHGQPITDDGLKHLQNLPNLRRLQLGATHVTGSGLEALTNIEWIRLDATPVSDDALRVIGSLKKLKQLYLDSTSVGDAGLAHLEGLTDLRVLNVHDTKVTAEGLAKLKRALPKVVIGSDLEKFVDGAATAPASARTSVTLVTDGNLFLERWLNQLMPDDSRIMTPVEYEALPNAGDAVIFDRYVPKEMPAAATMFFGAVPSEGPIRAATAEAVKSAASLGWKEKHPILRDLDMKEIYAAEMTPLRITAGAEWLVDSTIGPMMAVGESGGYRLLVIGFALGESNWPTRKSFPVFMHQAISYLLTGAVENAADSPSSAPAEPVSDEKHLPEMVRTGDLALGITFELPKHWISDRDNKTPGVNVAFVEKPTKEKVQPSLRISMDDNGVQTAIDITSPAPPSATASKELRVDGTAARLTAQPVPGGAGEQVIVQIARGTKSYTLLLNYPAARRDVYVALAGAIATSIRFEAPDVRIKPLETQPTTTQAALKSVRLVFRPTTTGSGNTHWSAPIPDRSNSEKNRAFTIVSAYRGDSFPVKVQYDGEPVFTAKLIDGDENQLVIETSVGNEVERFTVAIGKLEKRLIDNREFVFNYTPSTVNGTETQHVDYAALFISFKLDEATTQPATDIVRP